MPLPLAIGVSVVGGIVNAAEKKRIEAHIQDRVKKYRLLSTSQLNEVYAMGGEAGEAARRVLNERPTTVIPPKDTMVVPLTDQPTPGSQSNIMWVALIGVGLLLFMRK